MPLLHRKNFVPRKPPAGLQLDEEVFHCPLTNEIFRDYEEFYERTILCNSLVWSCCVTDRPNLTYQEALDCEEVAKRKLSKVSPSILKPILFLVGLSSKSRVDELNEDIYSFVKERYFVGESVDVTEGKLRQPCIIVKAIPLKETPSNGYINGDSPAVVCNSSDDEDDVPLSTYKQFKPLDGDEVKYLVKRANGTDKLVAHSCVRRKQGVFTRQTSKLFLKGNCVKPYGFATDNYVVKDNVKAKFELDKLKWEDIFTGPVPSFSSSPKTQKTKKVTEGGFAKAKSGKTKEQKEKDQLKHTREMEKEERKKEKEELKKKRVETMEKMRESARLDKEKKKKEREEELLKLRVEKETIRHQKLEEKRRLAEYLKEWSRPRDDLECDDLKELPTPHEIKTTVPPSLFGEVLSLLEFFNSFGELFESADEFPDGVSFDLISNALMKHNHHGPLCDFLFVFLSNLFRTSAEEEDTFNNIHADSTDLELSSRLRDRWNEETLQSFATLASTWPEAYQGFSLNKLELDSFTVTEILRLYLLSSAARPRGDDRLWRYQHRGGYTTFDDTPANLCFQNPALVEKLGSITVFDLTPEEKLSILMCLSNHLMSFVAPRDYLDETWDKYTQALQAYRDDKMMDKRREKELAAEKSKFKYEQMNLEKQARLKEAEEKLKQAELGIVEREEYVERNLRKRKAEDEDEEDDRPRLLDPLERVERFRAFEEEELQAKEAWSFRLQKHQRTIDKYQSTFRVSCLGQDRYYRRYWTISSVAGVFVEEFVDDSLTDDLFALKVPQKKNTFTLSSQSGCSTPGLSETNSAVETPVGFTPNFLIQPSGTTSLNTTQSSLNMSNGALSPLVLTNYPTTSNSGTAGGKFAMSFRKIAIDNQSSPILKQAACMNAAAAMAEQCKPVGTSTNECNPTNEVESFSNLSNFTQGKKHRWLVFSSTEEIDNLLSSLNTRGYRESKLRQKITSMRDVIVSRFATKRSLLDQFLSNKGSAETNIAEEKCAGKIEYLLREQILDLEERLWQGTLGTARIGNRAEWRECLLNDTKYEGPIIEDLSIPVLNESIEDGDKQKEVVCPPVVSFPIKSRDVSRSGDSDADTDEAMVTKDEKAAAVKELAIALLLVERGVDRKYLKHPLGCAVDSRKGTRSRVANEENEEVTSRKSEILLKRWESSLLSCSSIPQVFLHLSTIERSIMWSRSILNAKCRICRRKGDAEKMLLCDSCDRGHHMYCLKPVLKNVPAGDWFCPDCKPKSSRLSPRKVVRTKSFSQDASSDEEDDSEDEESEIEVESEESESSEVEVTEPAKKKLTYKIPQKSKRNSSSAKNKPALDRRERPKRTSGKVNIGSSKRRTDVVWRALATCEEILSEVIKHKDSWPFLEPVSKKLVPDYYTIIKKPMDLGTVLSKLKNVEYQSPADFIEDVDQIFLNCHEYNDSRSSIARTATHLQTFFDSKLNENGLAEYRVPYASPAKKRKTC